MVLWESGWPSFQILNIVAPAMKYPEYSVIRRYPDFFSMVSCVVLSRCRVGSTSARKDISNQTNRNFSIYLIFLNRRMAAIRM